MREFYGTSVNDGIAIADIKIYANNNIVSMVANCDTDVEKNRFKVSRLEAINRFNGLYNMAVISVSKDTAEVLNSQALILSDNGFIDTVNEIIESQKVNAEYAVKMAAEKIAEGFLTIDDEYIRERATDVKEAADYVIDVLLNNESNSKGKIFDLNRIEESAGVDESTRVDGSNRTIHEDKQYILIADELSPGDLITLVNGKNTDSSNYKNITDAGKSKIAAIVTKHGSELSHTTIIARALGIPALINIDLDLLKSGLSELGLSTSKSSKSNQLINCPDNCTGIVDCYNGKIIIDPDEKILASYKDKLNGEETKNEHLNELIGKEDITKSGKKIKLYANISRPEDVDIVLKNDAAGIGLYRSEFMILGNGSVNAYPSEDEQFAIYKSILEKMNGKKVIIRTFDLSGDKILSKPHDVSVHNSDSENLISKCGQVENASYIDSEQFRIQLRALFRASKYGSLSIMYPMISTVEEVTKIKSISSSVYKELEKEITDQGDTSCNNEFHIEEGIMIETLAAVNNCGDLAEHVDYFCIGTNDLMQEAFGINRFDNKSTCTINGTDRLLDIIKNVVISAHDNNIWAGVCGEIAADTSLTNKFVDLGIDELSVSPAKLLSIRNEIRKSK